jgi:hypothetical protein
LEGGLEMSKAPIPITRIYDDSQWDSLVQSSREANPFLMSPFLKSVGKSNSRAVIVEEGKAVLGACNFESIGDEPESKNGINLYQGVFFPEIKDSNYQDDNERLRLLGAYVASLDVSGMPLELSFHPNVKDIRAVDWYYYENSESNLEAKQRIQYTGQVQLANYNGYNEYLKSIRKVRLDELKRSYHLDLKVVQGSDRIDQFMELYKLTFSRQAISISDSQIKQVEQIIKGSNFAFSGSLDMVYSRSGTPLSGVFILSDKNTDIYLFGATDPQYRKEFGSTRLILDAIKRSFETEKLIFDFCGMNSPKRGEFKSSFNARIVPYFELELVTKKT